MDPEEQLRLIQDALWHMRWSLAFSLLGLVVETIAVVEIFQGNAGTWLTLMALALVSWLIGYYLRSKAREYRQRADGIEKHK